ncbi:hypothetical protein [Nitrospira moscoviensis]|uniref:Single cache domain-containing protein n=1 Tax=Nitrospira moscoviensis TaxID=42253 RepID=A0A0K2GFL1_NITMO|nr:hypothetical protein [Nitrospira moscoviensis]ALA59639.1 hypothetical protein NITMOv2_3244 [Nitrospira moscoviensis]
MSERDKRWPKQTILPTIAISTLTTLLIGSMLYYTLKRHDLARVQEVAQATERAGEEHAIAAGRIFAAASRSVMLADVARLQDVVTSLQRLDGLRDAMIVNRDNTVLAARNPAQVGQTFQDPTWAAWKSQNRAVAQRAVDQSGQPVFVVVEPLADKGDVLAWMMLVFAAPDRRPALRAPEDRMMEVGRLMAPIGLFLLIGVGLAMKLATGTIRKQIQGVMADMLEETDEAEAQQPWLRKVS